MEIKFLNVSLKEKNKYLIKNFNLQIKSNEITGIYNDNFNIITKLLTSDTNYKGDILIDSKSFHIISKSIITYIDELTNNTFLTKKVSDEFYLTKRNIQDDDSNYIKKVVASLNMVGLPELFLERDIITLSKSEKRLLQIAISLITNPDIIIINEPFLYLDKNNKANIRKILFDLKKKYQKTIIILSQDINTLYELTNYLVIFKDKKLLISDSTNLIFNDLNILENNEIDLPNIVLFNKIALNYNKKIPNTKDVKDLIKDVYKNVFQTKKDT